MRAGHSSGTLPRMIAEPDRDALRAAVDRESRLLAGRIRAGDRLDGPAPGLDWTAGQVVAHLCVVYRAFALAVRGADLTPDIVANLGVGKTLPEVVASTNARALTVGRSRAPARLPTGCSNAPVSCSPPWTPARISGSPGPRLGTGPASPGPSAHWPR